MSSFNPHLKIPTSQRTKKRSDTCWRGIYRKDPESTWKAVHGHSSSRPSSTSKRSHPSGPCTNLWIQVVVPVFEGPGEIFSASNVAGSFWTMNPQHYTTRSVSRPSDLAVVSRFHCLAFEKTVMALKSALIFSKILLGKVDASANWGYSLAMLPEVSWSQPTFWCDSK